MSGNSKTVLNALKWGQHKLEETNIANARFEAEVLLAHIMGQSHGEIYLNFPLPISAEHFSLFQEAIIKRSGHFPLQYITGSQEFMSLEFLVTPEVLIPRPDTEVLVEKIIERVRGIVSPKILDIGTGSGAIAISLAKYITASSVWATDISGEALRVAGENAVRNGVKINFKQGDLFFAVAAERFDIITSNPPYIPSKDIEKLMPEVRAHEPKRALDGGADGLYYYRQIIEQAPNFLKPKGIIALEIGFDQAGAVQDIINNQRKYGAIALFQDYGGRDRVLIADLL